MKGMGVGRTLGVLGALVALAASVWVLGEKLGWWHVPLPAQVADRLDSLRD